MFFNRYLQSVASVLIIKRSSSKKRRKLLYRNALYKNAVPQRIFNIGTVITYLGISPLSRFHSVVDGFAKLPHLANTKLTSAVFVKLLVKHNEVCVGIRLERTLDALKAEHAGGGLGDGLDGPGYGGAGPVEEVVDAFDEGDGAAGDTAGLLLGEDGPALDDAGAVGPLVDAVGKAGKSHGVGDEDEAVRVRVPGDLDRRRVQVDAVGDEAEEGFLGRGRRGAEEAENARIAMVQGPHGVEEVSDHLRAGVHGLGGFFKGGFGVSDGDTDAASLQLGDAGERAWELRGEGDQPDGAVFGVHVLSSVTILKVRDAVRSGAENREIVDAVLCGAHEGSFAVSAQRLGSVSRISTEAGRTKVW